MPEHIQPAKHIKQVEKRIESASQHLQLQEKDAKGLIGDKKREPQKEKENNNEK